MDAEPLRPIKGEGAIKAGPYTASWQCFNQRAAPNKKKITLYIA